MLVGVLASSACGSSGATGLPGGGATTSPSGSGPAGVADCGGRSSATGKYLGVDTTTFCGPAAVTIKIGATTYLLNGGRCVSDPSAGFAINVGTMASGMADIPTDGPQYFGIVAPTNAKAMATGLVVGHILIITDGSEGGTVIVAADHESGSISGSTIEGEPVTASFTC
jgi:hypothetical protein